MSRNRRAVGHRISLLATSSMVASTLLAGVGGVALTAFTPATALAAVCGAVTPGTYGAPLPSGGGTILCGPGPVSSIGFTSNGTGTDLVLEGNTKITGNTAGDGGLLLTSNSAQNLGLTVAAGFTGGFIDSTGSGDDGIHLASQGGTVQVTTGVAGGGPITVTGDINGISASTTLGSTVDVSALLADGGSKVQKDVNLCAEAPLVQF